MQGPSRRIVHVLYYPMTRRAQDLEIIEEPGLLENVRVELRMEKKPARVMLALAGKEIPFRYENGYVSCELGKVAAFE